MDVLLSRIARLDFIVSSVNLINQLVAILNATAVQSSDDTNSVILCDTLLSNSSPPVKTVVAPDSVKELPSNASSIFAAPSKTGLPRTSSKESLSSAASSVCHMERIAEGYDVATYISARHRQFLDLSCDPGIIVLNREGDSTLSEDVVTTIYYLINTVVQFLQLCVHHSGVERRDRA